MLIGVVALAVLSGLYVADLMSAQGRIARGVVLDGVRIAEMSTPDAEHALRAALEPRTTQPIAVVAAEVRASLEPRAAGLRPDWAATVHQAAVQPLNPWTRLTSFFADRDLAVVSAGDDTQLTTALGQVARLAARAPTEAAVRFDGLEPLPVEPVAGSTWPTPLGWSSVTG
ncbi:MAG: hypothetical protein M3Z25_02030 [Actinomycetota bacterium]|nr:hypothetical protein [Actinomycetota bacterium]